MPGKGLVIVNTGNGKGKTTAALGLMFRAWGHGMKVVMLQFIKSSKRKCGEYKAAEKIGIEIVPGGAGFVFKADDTSAHQALAVKQWGLAKERISSGGYDMVVLDEITYALKFGWIGMEDLIDVLKKRPPALHVILTGRDAPQELVEFADTVMEVTDIKHHFREGIKQQPGIEF